MIEALTDPSKELTLAIEQVRVGGAILLEDFSRPAVELGIREKNDHTGVTDTDVRASNAIVANIGILRGERTVTEECDSTPPELRHFLGDYTDDPVWVADPMDGTANFIAAVLANPNLDPDLKKRISTAMVSLGRVAGGRLVTGALLAPLLGVEPILYAGEEGKGAFREQHGVKTELAVDPKVVTGLVLVSDWHTRYEENVREIGFETLGISGLVFKLCAVLDPKLLPLIAGQLEPDEREKALHVPVVGLISRGSRVHDYAAGVVIAREANAFVATPHGSPDIPIAPGEHGIIVARNARIGAMLVEAAQATKQ